MITKLTRTTAPTPQTSVPEAEAIKAKTEIANHTRATLIQVNTLDIRTSADYAMADTLLGKVNTAIKTVDAKFDPIINPIAKALSALRKLKSEVSKPLEQAKASLRYEMTSYERRRIEIEQEAQRVEADRLRAEAEAKEKASAKAKTEQMRTKLAEQREALQAQAVEVEQAPVIITPRMPSSNTVIVKSWRITNMAEFLQAVGAGDIPANVVSLNVAVLNAAARDGRMDSWPGIEAYDDVQIRSGR